jgi:hypothetical protein
MLNSSLLGCVTAAAAAVAFTAGASAQVELTSNGDFELGNVSGFVSFPTANSTFATTTDSASGQFAGRITNPDTAAGAVVKQANIGIGEVSAGETLDISFDAKGTFVDGGVAFAEFFSELSGGGTSSNVILGGGPLFTATETAYQTFNFQVVTGADVSGGVTLQFVATTGGAPNSFADLFIDNVSVSTIPEPTSAALLGLGGLALMARRRAA